MPFLMAAVVLVGAVCLLNLLLTFGVIRRLRLHTAQLEKLGSGGEGLVDDAMPSPGDTVGKFTATTVDGEPVSLDRLVGQTLIAFFAQGCDVCEETIPAFVDYAQSFPGGRRQVLAVVSGVAAEVTEMINDLDPVARVVVEEHTGPVTEAFAMRAFPVFCLVDSTGTVLGAEIALALLQVPTGV